MPGVAPSPIMSKCFVSLWLCSSLRDSLPLERSSRTPIMRPPLVSCIMPTYERRRFVPQALRCFANRAYRNAELIVVDDSERSVRSLCEGVDGVRYLRVRVTSTGVKLNLGIEAARGDIVQKVD